MVEEFHPLPESFFTGRCGIGKNAGLISGEMTLLESPWTSYDEYKLAGIFNQLLEVHLNNDNSVPKVRIPIWVWAIVAALVIGSLAIFVFNVPFNTVVTYGFFILMISSHFFMHGSHGAQENHSDQPAGQNKDDPNPKNKNQTGKSGGCH
jgi:hypothetical protein